jgi:hypothetical protein
MELKLIEELRKEAQLELADSISPKTPEASLLRFLAQEPR